MQPGCLENCSLTNYCLRQVLLSLIMDILFLLIPMSVVLVLLILGGLSWAISRGQFESLDGEGQRILNHD